MAGDWLKMDSSTPEKPEVLAITSRMGWDDPDMTVGKLFRVWRWFDQHTTDGNAKGVTSALLDRIAGVAGFAQAMQAEGWLIVSDAGLSLPKFDRHNGATAKARVETARRVAKHRAKPEAAPDEGEYARLTVPRPIRAAVLDRDGHACVYCSRKEGEFSPQETKRDGYMHLDHVIPLTRGGVDDMLNLVTACGPCNMFKGDRTPDECGLRWPEIAGQRAGNTKTVTQALAREEKRRDKDTEANASVAPRATRKCPKDWNPETPDAWIAEHCPGLDWPRETAKFRDHTFKTAHSDWDGAWRNWMRRAVDDLPATKRAPTFKQRDAADAAERVRQMTGGLLNGGFRPENIIDMETSHAAQIGND